MGSKVISFRFDDDKLALLQQHQVEGESESQAAMRLLLGVLGAERKKLSIQSVDIVDTNQIKELIETAVQEKLTEFTTVDNVKNLIDDSLTDGKIGEAIASSYVAATGQMNGLLDELQQLKKQLQELQSSPPAAAAVPCSQLPIANEQLPITNEQLPIANEQLPITNEQIPDPTRNQIENIRTTLKRRGIQSVTNERIRKAFYDAGWDGQNYKELRQAVIDSLSAPK